MYKIKFYNREHIINTKRIEKKVSRAEAIRLVEESRLRAKAENIILKEQMNEKLEMLKWADYLK
jgi:superfamily I DNA and/or RNA helicase